MAVQLEVNVAVHVLVDVQPRVWMPDANLTVADCAVRRHRTKLPILGDRTAGPVRRECSKTAHPLHLRDSPFPTLTGTRYATPHYTPAGLSFGTSEAHRRSVLYPIERNPFPLPSILKEIHSKGPFQFSKMNSIRFSYLQKERNRFLSRFLSSSLPAIFRRFITKFQNRFWFRKCTKLSKTTLQTQKRTLSQ